LAPSSSANPPNIGVSTTDQPDCQVRPTGPIGPGGQAH
jgi:hypothetical protein